ncbi:MAG: cofactor-independent phosphoglycerate mutase [Bacillota bacterium]
MKYVVILGDGMADYPIGELGGKTPLQYAHTPNMDLLATYGEIGLVKTVPPGFPPGSDVANLAVLGYDPGVYYSGRSPLEAVSMGIQLADDEVAFRCNLVTLSDEEDYQDKIMLDYSAGEIDTAGAALLINELQSKLGRPELRFFPGISYRHLMVWQGGQTECVLTPPHDISDRKITSHLPAGPGAEVLIDLMRKSAEILKDHPVNLNRTARGMRPATSIWFWGQGKKPSLTSFYKKYGLTGSVISAVDLIRGLGLCAGLEVVLVEGATGNIHTNFAGKARAALDELRRGKDFVYVHVEAPDEAGHQGDLPIKIKAIEEIDEKVLGIILKGLAEFADYRIMVLPDHPTPLSLKTHTAEPVPYVMMKRGQLLQPDMPPRTYNEETAALEGTLFPEGHLLMNHFIKNK